MIGEADGLGAYTGPEVLWREKARVDGFAQLGFLVFRWTWRDAYHRPDALAHRAGEVLARGQRSRSGRLDRVCPRPQRK